MPRAPGRLFPRCLVCLHACCVRPCGAGPAARSCPSSVLAGCRATDLAIRADAARCPDYDIYGEVSVDNDFTLVTEGRILIHAGSTVACLGDSCTVRIQAADAVVGGAVRGSRVSISAHGDFTLQGEGAINVTGRAPGVASALHRADLPPTHACGDGAYPEAFGSRHPRCPEGRGGGTVFVSACGTATVHGGIEANGLVAGNGGSVLVMATEIRGAGTVAAVGACSKSRCQDCATGAGGGCVAVHAMSFGDDAASSPRLAASGTAVSLGGSEVSTVSPFPLPHLQFGVASTGPRCGESVGSKIDVFKSNGSGAPMSSLHFYEGEGVEVYAGLEFDGNIPLNWSVSSVWLSAAGDPAAPAKYNLTGMISRLAAPAGTVRFSFPAINCTGCWLHVACGASVGHPGEDTGPLEYRSYRSHSSIEVSIVLVPRHLLPAAVIEGGGLVLAGHWAVLISLGLSVIVGGAVQLYLARRGEAASKPTLDQFICGEVGSFTFEVSAIALVAATSDLRFDNDSGLVLAFLLASASLSVVVLAMEVAALASARSRAFLQGHLVKLMCLPLGFADTFQISLYALIAMSDSDVTLVALLLATFLIMAAVFYRTGLFYRWERMV